MNGSCSDTADAAIMTTVSALSDDRLLERTKELSGIEHHLEVVVIDHLREIDKRRLYLRGGFSSLFDYAVRDLGYSDAAAWRRIKAMRLCADVDGVRERLQDGSMTLNAAAQLQNAFDRQERNRERAARSAPGGDRFGDAARSQDGSAPASGSAQPERKPAPVLDRSARRALVEQAAGKSSRQVMELLAEVDPELAAPADRVRPLGAGRWEIKAVIDDECRRGLERLKGLLSHVDPHMTLGQIMGRLVREGLDRHDPARPPRGRRTGSRAAGAEQTSAAKTQAASARGADSAAKQEASADSVAPSAAKHEAGSDSAAPSAAKHEAGSDSAVPSATKHEAGSDSAAPSATKHEAGSDSAVPSAAKVSAQAVGQPGDGAAAPLKTARVPDRPDTLAATPATDSTSAAKMKTRRLGRPAAACAKPAAPPRTQTSAAKAGGGTARAIPAAVKRAVWRRDRGRCSYVDRTSGRRCGSHHLLQIDHVVPYAKGGAAETNNLRLLCAAHHRHRHRHAGAGFGRPGDDRQAPVPFSPATEGGNR